MITKTFDGPTAAIYPCEKPDAPVVYFNLVYNTGDQILAACKESGVPPFHLVMLYNLRWDQDLSPYPHAWVVEPDDDFTGQAPQYLDKLLNEIVPFLHEQLPQASTPIIAGYSMGGLFALFALMKTDYFVKAASVSGSVWYPGFVDYMKKEGLKAVPAGVYLSVGSAESKVRNKVLQTTAACDEELEAWFRSQGIECVFEINPGNHFQHINERIVQGLNWILKN